MAASLNDALAAPAVTRLQLPVPSHGKEGGTTPSQPAAPSRSALDSSSHIAGVEIAGPERDCTKPPRASAGPATSTANCLPEALTRPAVSSTSRQGPASHEGAFESAE